jgi:threonine dehydratase
LSGLGKRWNISLFHYRNHGAAYGRVLMGLQIPPEEYADFEHSLAGLSYPHWDETDNPAYRIFAGNG